MQTGPSRTLTAYSHPDEVRELAFAVYITSDRKASRTHRRLSELLDPDQAVPTESVIRRWAKAQNWDMLADEAIAENFPHLLRRDLARLTILRGESLGVAGQILEGELDHLGQAQLSARTATIQTIIQTSGLGTAGAQVDQAALAPGQKVEALSAEVLNDPNKLAFQQLQRIERARGRD